MVTGDAPLTSLHIAKKTRMISNKKKPLLLNIEEDKIFWIPMLLKNQLDSRITFSENNIHNLLKKYELVVTEEGLRKVPSIWDHLEKVSIYSRMSPQGKADVVDRLKQTYNILYVGDGGNDVGALKQANVGVALLTGFGNANVVKTREKKIDYDDIWGILKNRNKKKSQRMYKLKRKETERVII